MRTIHKYRTDLNRHELNESGKMQFDFKLPESFEVVDAEIYDNSRHSSVSIALWINVNTNDEVSTRTFDIVSTGSELPEYECGFRFIKTVHASDRTYHIILKNEENDKRYR